MDEGQAGPVVELRGVGKTFGGVTAVSDVDLKFHAGEVHALVGENGAGKSTLMKIIDGVQRADSGQLLVDGRPVDFSSVHDAESAGIAMIPQELELFPELSVAENLYIGRRRPRTRFGLIDHRQMRCKTEELFALLGARVDPGALVSTLRAATRQLVAIARALLADARLVIMDEPTAALTDHEVHKLFDIIDSLSRRGVAVVYISHRLDEVFRLSNTITVLRDGRIVRTAAAADFTEQEVIRLMVGRPLSQLYTRRRAAAGPPVLEVHELTRKGEFEDISLTVHAGEIVGLAGLIGSGRTEFAHALMGYGPATSGTIRLDGQPVSPRSVKQSQDVGLAYIPEERRADGLILSFSIAANISYGRLEQVSRFGLVDRRAENAVAARYCKDMAVRTTSIAAPVGQLSGGNQQKVVIAKAFARDPKILILDEPTRGVDVGAKAEIYRLIDELAAGGKAIILISSELPEVLSMADRIVVLREGRQMAEFDYKAATAELVTAAATGTAGHPAAADEPDERREMVR
jgi:ABC-type sugar transport system ATPase subunit